LEIDHEAAGYGTDAMPPPIACAPAADAPYAPPGGVPVRLAFVGQGTFFEACALQDGVSPLRSAFFEFRQGGDADALLRRLDEFAPHVVLVFRPEIVPAGLFAGLRAASVGFLTEPIPRSAGHTATHADLQVRLSELRQVDASNFDRVVCFDPLISATANEVLPVWRSLPLPVADRYFSRARPGAGAVPATAPLRVLFVGRSTPHREHLLADAKADHDILHMAFGVDAAHLEELLRAHDVGINIHNNPYPSFENRVCLHLAAGHLVLSEPLNPLNGLEPGIDFVEFKTAWQLTAQLTALRRFPGMGHAVRVRGRHKAEIFRASRVYPRLIGDLFADLAAFGTERAVA
jgi:hypothetical protein